MSKHTFAVILPDRFFLFSGYLQQGIQTVQSNLDQRSNQEEIDPGPSMNKFLVFNPPSAHEKTERERERVIRVCFGAVFCVSPVPPLSQHIPPPAPLPPPTPRRRHALCHFFL